MDSFTPLYILHYSENFEAVTCMVLRLPSRYEDLDDAFRGRLIANPDLLDAVKRAFRSMEVSGGIRFLPIYGESGSGKTSAALELGTHLPELLVFPLSRIAIEDQIALKAEINEALKSRRHSSFVGVVDQYEEAAAQRAAIPTSFVETLSLLDRSELRDKKILFIWLTTSREFQRELDRFVIRRNRL